MLSGWWRDYHAAAEEQIEQGDYSPLVETYLTTMLGRRLGLSPPSPHRAPKEPLATLQMLGGAESLRLAILRETSSAEAIRNEAADQPLPDAAAWVPAESPAVPPDVDIEPIAMRVPRECFYLRFGSFENYLWLDRLQRDYGGDLGRMITLRGVRLPANERLQQQMGLRRSALDELMGPTIVSDVAIIGRDMFFRDGAATGILFQARNGLLGTGLSKQRNDALAQQRADGAKMETVTIGGRDVSFLSTPTNRLRSFYVVDGDYHLVTTSRQIVERFLAVRDGTGSLGASEEFRHARSLLPTSREDTIFAYFSSAFLQGLLSPHYQVELRRRFQATANLELIRMASWTANREGRPAKNLDDLVQGGYLPPGFGTQADGSRPARSGATLVDSLRGARRHVSADRRCSRRGHHSDRGRTAAGPGGILRRRVEAAGPLAGGHPPLCDGRGTQGKDRDRWPCESLCTAAIRLDHLPVGTADAGVRPAGTGRYHHGSRCGPGR